MEKIEYIINTKNTKLKTISPRLTYLASAGLILIVVFWSLALWVAPYSRIKLNKDHKLRLLHVSKKLNKEADTDKPLRNDDIYIPEDLKPSPLIKFLKYTLIIGVVIFVSFFMYCSVQLGKIGH